MSKVFTPIFCKIANLVNSQKGKVEEQHKPGIKVSSTSCLLIQKVIFLVGGFGSNQYLAKYLSWRNPLGAIVRQPGGG